VTLQMTTTTTINQPTHTHTGEYISEYCNQPFPFFSAFFSFLYDYYHIIISFFLYFAHDGKPIPMHKTRLCSLTLCGSHGGHESGKLQPNECGNRAKFHTTKDSTEVSFPVFQLGVGGFCNNNSSSRRIRISSHRRRRRRRRRASVKNNRCCQQSACVGEASFFSFLFFYALVFIHSSLIPPPFSFVFFFFYSPPRSLRKTATHLLVKERKWGKEVSLSLFLFDSCPMASCRHTKGEH